MIDDYQMIKLSMKRGDDDYYQKYQMKVPQSQIDNDMKRQLRQQQ